MAEENLKKNPRDWLKIIQYAFWISFFIIPFATGLLAYHWLPNESPILSGGQVIPPNEVISSHEECHDSGTSNSSCGTVVDVWRDTNTGKIYTHSDFKNHHDSERKRIALYDFFYGLIACFFVAGIDYYKKKDFFRIFGIAVIIDLVIALYMYLTF